MEGGRRRRWYTDKVEGEGDATATKILSRFFLLFLYQEVHFLDRLGLPGKGVCKFSFATVFAM
jgi:hypothetical protein